MLKKTTHKKQEESQLTLFKAVQKPEKVKKVKEAKKVRKDPKKKTPPTSKEKVVKKTPVIKKVQKSRKKQPKGKKTLPPLTTKKKESKKNCPQKPPLNSECGVNLWEKRIPWRRRIFFFNLFPKRMPLIL